MLVARTVDLTNAAMRRLLCLLSGHKPGLPIMVMGIEMRVCARCSHTVSSRRI